MSDDPLREVALRALARRKLRERITQSAYFDPQDLEAGYQQGMTSVAQQPHPEDQVTLPTIAERRSDFTRTNAQDRAEGLHLRLGGPPVITGRPLAEGPQQPDTVMPAAQHAAQETAREHPNYIGRGLRGIAAMAVNPSDPMALAKVQLQQEDERRRREAEARADAIRAGEHPAEVWAGQQLEGLTRMAPAFAVPELALPGVAEGALAEGAGAKLLPRALKALREGVVFGTGGAIQQAAEGETDPAAYNRAVLPNVALGTGFNVAGQLGGAAIGAADRALSRFAEQGRPGRISRFAQRVAGERPVQGPEVDIPQYIADRQEEAANALRQEQAAARALERRRMAAQAKEIMVGEAPPAPAQAPPPPITPEPRAPVGDRESRILSMYNRALSEGRQPHPYIEREARRILAEREVPRPISQVTRAFDERVAAAQTPQPPAPPRLGQLLQAHDEATLPPQARAATPRPVFERPPEVTPPARDFGAPAPAPEEAKPLWQLLGERVPSMRGLPEPWLKGIATTLERAEREIPGFTDLGGQQMIEMAERTYTQLKGEADTGSPYGSKFNHAVNTEATLERMREETGKRLRGEPLNDLASTPANQALARQVAKIKPRKRGGGGRTLASVAPPALGATIGGQIGNTPEERARNAQRGLLAGTALSLAGAPLVLRGAAEGEARLAAQGAATGPRYGYVELPSRYRGNSAVEAAHNNAVQRTVRKALGDQLQGSHRVVVGGAAGSHATSLYTFKEVSDEAMRRNAALVGLVEGQESQTWHRVARAGDEPMPANGTTGTTASVVMTGPNHGPIPARTAQDLLRAMRQHPDLRRVANATYDAKSGHLFFLNTKRYTSLSDADFNALLQYAPNLTSGPIELGLGSHYAETLDGPRSYLSAIGADELAVRAARNALDAAEPHYVQYARRVGADPAATAARIAERRAGLDAVAKSLSEPVPAGLSTGDRLDILPAGKKLAAEYGPLPHGVDPVVAMAERVNQQIDRGVKELGIPAERLVRWYTEAHKDQRPQLQLAIPELRDDKQWALFNVISSIMSQGNQVGNEVRAGALAYENYLRTGHLSIFDPSGVRYFSAGGKKGAEGQLAQHFGEQLQGNIKANQWEDSLRKLDLFVNRYGVDGALDRLTEILPIRGRAEGEPALIGLFGEKIGEYAAGKMGLNRDQAVLDLWMARTHHLLQGNELPTRIDKIIKNGRTIERTVPDDQITPAMRERMNAVLQEVARQRNISVQSAQALAWYGMKADFRRIGAAELPGAYETLSSGTTDFLTSQRENVREEPYTFGEQAGKATDQQPGWGTSGSLDTYFRRKGETATPAQGPWEGKEFPLPARPKPVKAEAPAPVAAPEAEAAVVPSRVRRGVSFDQPVTVGKVTFDNDAGLGAVSDAKNIGYMGSVAYMRPSEFLGLNPHRDTGKASVAYITKALEDGRSVGMPFLNAKWEDGHWRVTGHEGRTRVAAILKFQGDEPIPVAVLPRNELRARHITDEMANAPFRPDKRVIDPYYRDLEQGRDAPVRYEVTPSRVELAGTPVQHGERGATISPVVRTIAGAGTGAAIGATQDPEHPLRGAALGALAGATAVHALPAIVKAIRTEAPRLADATKKILAPALRGPEARAAAGELRAQLGHQHLTYEQAVEHLAPFRAAVEKLPDTERYMVIDRIENGQKQATPELQAAADAIRKLLDDTRDEVRQLGTKKLTNFYLNYFPHIWEDPNKARNVIADMMGRRPLAGPGSFLRRRTVFSTMDGLHAGLTPVTSNPLDLALMKVYEMRRYIMANRTVQALEQSGQILKVQPGKTPIPNGWVKLKDNAFTTYASPQAGGRIVVGEYYAPEPVATIFNNHLSPGLRGNPLYDLYRKAGNSLNQAQLGLSAFHLGMTSIDAATSRTALAIGQLRRGQPLRALGTAVTAPAAPFTNIYKGHKLLQELLRPGSVGGEFGKMVEPFIQAGGRVRMDSMYNNGAWKSFRDALRGGRWGAAAWHGLPAALEVAAKPIMDVVVPRQKLGVFMDLAQDEMARLGPTASKAEVRAALQRTWDSVDNRMGQLVYDNLFWNRSLKDLSMAGVRSVGWNLGTIRELGGGALDLARLKNTPRANYAMALPITVGLMGAVTNYLYTGEAPRDLHDYFYPRTGRKNAEGNEERLQLPSYMKDVFAYTQHPWQTAKHKLHPELSIISEMLENRDFYGDRIRNEYDPRVQQGKQLAQYLARQYVPFGIRNIAEQRKRRQPLDVSLGSEFGLTPAPREQTRTPAQNLVMAALGSRRPTGGLPEERAASVRRSDLLEQLRTGGKEQLLDQAQDRGEINERQRRDLIRRAGEDPWVSRFKQLSVANGEVQRVWEAATPAERRRWREVYDSKMERYTTDYGEVARRALERRAGGQ